MCETLRELHDFNPRPVGRFYSINVNEKTLYVIDSNSETKKDLPKHGYLFRSPRGENAIINRRIKAKENILKGLAPIPNLALIVAGDVSIARQTRYEQAITHRLKEEMQKTLGKPVEFNLAQKKAIEIALNTPDLALILGPPGTGKTTVIKAIIARFEEFFERDNGGQIPHILVTSFQHEAVDNAITNINSYGLPVNRIGVKPGKESKQEQRIKSWIDLKTERFSANIQKFETPKIYTKLEAIQDEYFAWLKKGKDLFDGIELLERIIQKYRIELSVDLVNNIDKLISNSKSIHSQGDELSRVKHEIEIKGITTIINRQRIDKDSFADDGINNAMQLRIAIEHGMFKGEIVPDCLVKVISTKGAEEKIFSKYVEYVRFLQQKYLEKQNIPQDNKIRTTEVELYVDQVLIELGQLIIKSPNNVNEITARILQAYLNKITNEEVAADIINRYSHISAATCQGSMEHDKTQVYDLVIVDEAARANPLDLFIPLSMGKQVILVGDHKQLPHMLEPEVVKKLVQSEDHEALEKLQKSLFERLYNNFEEQFNKNGGLRRTCQLDTQYRMHRFINEFVSNAFYDGKLKCDPSVDEHPLILNSYKGKPMVWIDVNKQQYGVESQGLSKAREPEAAVLIENANKVLHENGNIKLGIITFYLKQKDILEKLAGNKLTSDELARVEIGTVDSFQGKEFDVVFLSCVRSNSFSANNLKRRVGFVNDNNHLCVSLSRAKSLLVIVGDSETVNVVPSLNNFIELCKKGVGEYINA